MTRPHLTALLVAAGLLAGCSAPGPSVERGGPSVTTSPPGGGSRHEYASGSRTNRATTTTTATTTSTTVPSKPAELPRGGRQIFPAFRVVANYGNAQSPSLGILGETPPEEAASRLAPVAEAFGRPGRPVLPAFELIVTVAQRSPGPNGTYSVPTPDDLVQRWLDAARAADMLLVLDLQPGAGRFLEDAKRFERFLLQPEVGLALDPEWRMPPGVVPGRQIGSADAAEINEVSTWLADLVAAHDLPEKLFVIHQFTESMITDRDAVVDQPGLATVFHIDGFGGQTVKLAKYEQLKGPYAKGLKLFYDEDTDMFDPAAVLALPDPPDLVTYQ